MTKAPYMYIGELIESLDLGCKKYSHEMKLDNVIPVYHNYLIIH